MAIQHKYFIRSLKAPMLCFVNLPNTYWLSTGNMTLKKSIPQGRAQSLEHFAFYLVKVWPTSQEIMSKNKGEGKKILITLPTITTLNPEDSVMPHLNCNLCLNLFCKQHEKLYIYLNPDITKGKCGTAIKFVFKTKIKGKKTFCLLGCVQ